METLGRIGSNDHFGGSNESTPMSLSKVTVVVQRFQSTVAVQDRGWFEEIFETVEEKEKHKGREGGRTPTYNQRSDVTRDNAVNECIRTSYASTNFFINTVKLPTGFLPSIIHHRPLDDITFHHLYIYLWP